MTRGFIIQPTYRIESGRPVVHLYGKLEDDRSFLVRDTRSVPHFWIRRADAERARPLGASRQAEDDSPRRTMGGDPVVRVEVRIPSDALPLRDRLAAGGVECFEADVRFASRYLLERSIRGSVEIDGPGARGRGVDLVFDDPEVTPGDFVPRLSVLSIDIETDPGASRLLSIALVGAGTDEVLLVTPEGCACPDGATACPDERSLLHLLVERVQAVDPDVITGWNVVDFDLTVLLRRAEALGVPLRIGRDTETLRVRPSSSPRSRQEALLTGRVVLDGINLLRGAFVKLESYALNAAAREILGKQKTIRGPDRAEQILRAFHEDRAHFVEYNRLDARLVLEILEKLNLIELAVERSRLTGLPPDRVDGSIAAFDSLYLARLAERGIVARSVRAVEGIEAQSGGHVLEPVPGLHQSVLVLDFRSLYPSIIRTFQIDPLGHAEASGGRGGGRDPITAPNGATFSRGPGILPRLLDDLFPRRAEAKAAGDSVADHAIKILMNSFYGVLGTSACRFADPALANAITGFGREILLWSKARLEEKGLHVVYGDTDSLFVLSGEPEADIARALGLRLAADLTADLAAHVREKWRVESRLVLEFEKLYLRLLLPVARSGSVGARKRYAGLLHADEPRVEFTGLEVVRRDWTPLARRVQRELYERLFTEQPVDEHLRETVADVRAGRLDDLLVYRKGLRRPLDSYTATTPPHVAAARKMSGRPGRVIEYVVTTAGPEPAAERTAPIDREHYVQKQVRAVAEPVLAVLKLEFDRVVGDEQQMLLFD